MNSERVILVRRYLKTFLEWMLLCIVHVGCGLKCLKMIYSGSLPLEGEQRSMKNFLK